MALPIFAITLFVSAFLLFMVQPMIGKMILPKLGGTPQVWNTCMVFFQCALLAGYGYTHTVSSKLNVKMQLLFHSAFLLLPLVFLLVLFGGPFNMDWWKPPAGGNPIPATLMILALVVAVPFIVVATSAPLLQRWFAYTGHPAAKDPYFLYGASNLGSMLALVSYPFVVEPFLTIHNQAWTWAIGYFILAVMVAVCAFLVWKAPPMVQLAGAAGATEDATEEAPAAKVEAKPAPSSQIQAIPSVQRSTGIRKGSKQRGKGAPVRSVSKSPGSTAPAAFTPSAPKPFVMSWWKRLRWVGLAAVPCSMMLGVTTYISTDISAIPLFWVVPLALYLLSFILVFMKWPVVWAAADTPPIPAIIQYGFLAMLLVDVVAFLFLGVTVGVILALLSIIVMFGLLVVSSQIFPNFYWKGVPHVCMLVLQPLGLIILALILLSGGFDPTKSMFFCMVGFFLTAMVCHGELARDRPPTKYLTEFFLWMSVGGALGGIFNAILAPLLFREGALEFPLVLVAAGLLRPVWGIEPWSYSLLKLVLPPETIKGIEDSGDDLARRMQGVPANEEGVPTQPVSLPQRGYLVNIFLDFVFALLIFGLAFFLVTNGSGQSWNWRGYYGMQDSPIFKFGKNVLGITNPYTLQGFTSNTANALIFGIPLLFCLLFFGRPIRFGLTLGCILLANTMFERDEERRPGRRLLHSDRSYFGILRVYEEGNAKAGGDRHRYLMHGTTHHGLNYQEPEAHRRLATTYYHSHGPVGAVMNRLNWFNDPMHSYKSDSRLTASLVGLGAANVFGTAIPLPQIVATHSEPAFACVGLGTGTMASYARPFQHLTFYEIDDKIRRFSLPEAPDFSYQEYLEKIAFKDEKEDVRKELIARATLNPNYFKYVDYIENRKDNPLKLEPYFNYVWDALKRGANIEIIMGDARLSLKNEDPELAKMFPPREKYYRVIELDALSSDAIPVHLITKEALQLYFEKLTKVPADVEDPLKFYGGVLMVHTSNRHVNLVAPVSRVATDLGLKYRVGKDGGDRGKGHFSSEYVMVAREEHHLPRSTLRDEWGNREDRGIQWYSPRPPSSAVWTDDYSNLVGVLRFGWWSVDERPEPDGTPRGDAEEILKAQKAQEQAPIPPRAP